MSLVLHWSDPHFGTELPAVRAALLRLVHELRPDVAVLSGDVTQRAQPSQFAAARAFCDELQVPRLLAMPGNHDIPLLDVFARAFNPYGRYKREFGDDLEPEFEGPDLLVACVNTTRPARHKDGEVSREQVERVAQRLAGARRGQLRVVVTHQPACVMRKEDEPDRLHGGHAAVQAWSKAGADLVLGGHIHLPYLTDVCARVKGAERAMYCVQAGTALSHRVRHGTPNSVNMIAWSAPAAGELRRCDVRRWDYDLADDRFECTHEYPLVLGD